MSFSLAQIDEAIDALLANAQGLSEEARLLLNATRYARAFALAHLAREEMSKAVMLQSTAVRILAQQPIQWKRLMVRLRDHKSKLKLEIVESALLLKGLGITEPSLDAVLASTKAAADYRNDQKNDSLYVGFKEGKFTSPGDLFTEHKASRTVQLAEARLEQLMFGRTIVPKYAARKIGSLSDMPNYDEMKPEEWSGQLDQTALLYSALALHQERLKSKPSS